MQTEVVNGLKVKSTSLRIASQCRQGKASFPWNLGDLLQILCLPSCQAAGNIHAFWLLRVPGCQITRHC